MLRVILLIATNFAIMILASITFQILGLEQLLAAQGISAQTTYLVWVCAFIGMGGSLVSLLVSKWMAKRAMGVRIIEQGHTQQERWLLNTVSALAKDAGIGMPEVGIFPSPVSNAFATGWNKNDALVAVSEGLLTRFSEAEVRAVLAHEIGHVANGDMVTLSLIQGVLNTLVLIFSRVIGSTIDRVVFKNERGYGMGYFIGSMIAQVVLGILASIIVMWFSRYREFRADAAGASLAGTSAMISALQRLQAEQGIPKDMPGEMTAFGISGDMKSAFGKLFLTHPPLTERIAALQQRG